MVQALYVALAVFIGKAEFFIGTAMTGRPIFLGALVGLLFGDLTTGVIIGFQLELVFMGSVMIGAAVPPDMIVGSVLGTAFALSANTGVDTAVAIAMPTALLSAFVVNLFYGVINPLIAKFVDKYAKNGKYKGVERTFLGTGFMNYIAFAIIAFLAYYLGNDVMSSVVNSIPDWLSNGLTIAAGILPALGFAQLMSMILSKKIVVFLMLGFFLTAFLEISAIGVLIVALSIVGTLLISDEFKNKKDDISEGDDISDF
ncbi:PTS mannose/fructose/sorbose/N-acetylgalactosamine transporter subunit IIC [Tetragenococcus koreensis]|uniref:PTS mannose/fructose/sorbose/N-acetylgalactosamine transporter subunit IIC n=1 Tax=Tetragenococcus koreensis TaxID=290335 RepID=UPI000F503DA3|nr:PTS sugar transporter subunit IIC [Tetragenococcus koreensis]AYW46084.1 PTS sugar transporter [Tetragenococcus koreensis]GEN92172.1 PTS sugar transporter [Tetragenococcus koreensis]